MNLDLIFPIKLDDDRTLYGVGPDEKRVGPFDDYLHEGDSVGMGEIPEDEEDRDPRPPFGVVVRKPDGLWIVQREVLAVAREFHSRFDERLIQLAEPERQRTPREFDELRATDQTALIEAVEALVGSQAILIGRGAGRER